MRYLYISTNGTTDPTQTLIYGLILAFGTNVFIAIMQYILQHNQLKHTTENLNRQLEEASKSLEKQLKQNEINLRIQLLHQEHKNSVDALWSILHQDLEKYYVIKHKLMEFLNESPEGYYLPMEIQEIIRDEIHKVDSFIRGTEIDLGIGPSDEELEQSTLEYGLWYQQLDTYKRANIETKEVVERFITRLKNRVRKYASGRG